MNFEIMSEGIKLTEPVDLQEISWKLEIWYENKRTCMLLEKVIYWCLGSCILAKSKMLIFH